VDGRHVDFRFAVYLAADKSFRQIFQIKSNQIKSAVDLVRLLQLERRRITLSS